MKRGPVVSPRENEKDEDELSQTQQRHICRCRKQEVTVCHGPVNPCDDGDTETTLFSGSTQSGYLRRKGWDASISKPL